MNGIMSYDLGKNEARIMKAMDDWAEDVVKNLSSNPVLAVSCRICDAKVEDEYALEAHMNFNHKMFKV